MRSCVRTTPRLLGRSRCFPAYRIPYARHGPNVVLHRSFTLDTLTTILIPPAVFGGLLVSLWTYKCMMMVVFQNKIIYMPSVPPFSRTEKVQDYAAQCRPATWIEHSIKSTDGTVIKLLEGSITGRFPAILVQHVVVLYLQGNASSLPPRLPLLSRILHSAQTSATEDTKVTIIGLSYRGFWTSGGSPSQPGIERDVHAALRWTFDRYPLKNTTIVLWGQSIGAGAATVSLANLIRSEEGSKNLGRIRGLLLETPFTDLKAMLTALYPQKFLPYRYLAPFLWSTWDSKTALAMVLDTNPKLDVLILQAGDDELVPADHALTLQEICKSRGARIEHVVVSNALHTDIMARPLGRQTISRYIASFGDKLDVS